MKKETIVRTLVIGLVVSAFGVNLPAAPVTASPCPAEPVAQAVPPPSAESLVEDVLDDTDDDDAVDCIFYIAGQTIPATGTPSIDSLNVNLGVVSCTHTITEVPESAVETLGTFTAPAEEPSDELICPPCWLALLAMEVIAVSIAIYLLIEHLTPDEDNTWEQTLSCQAVGNEVVATGSGGALRTVALVKDGVEATNCGGYDGLLTTSCEVRSVSDQPFEYEKVWYDDSVYKKKDVCFVPAVSAQNRPQYDALGLIQPPVTKSWSDFHPDEPNGVCIIGMEVEPEVVEAPSNLL